MTDRELTRVQQMLEAREPIVVCDIDVARALGPDFPAVISIRAVREFDAWKYEDRHPEQVLRLDFLDIDDAFPILRARFPAAAMRRLGAEEHHVTQALEFARAHRDEPLLVHCSAGVGRSTGIALAIQAERMGPGLEREAVEWLMAHRPTAYPNLFVVDLADQILERGGTLSWTVREFDRAEKRRMDERRWRSRALSYGEAFWFEMRKTCLIAAAHPGILEIVKEHRFANGVAWAEGEPELLRAIADVRKEVLAAGISLEDLDDEIVTAIRVDDTERRREF